MLLSTRRYKDARFQKSFKQRTWLEKLQFWKAFYYYSFVEIPKDSPEYDNAPFQEVIFVDSTCYGKEKENRISYH